jgi:beta-lactam-binding protein with PASTA domain
MSIRIAAVAVLASGAALTAGCSAISNASSCTKVANTIASTSKTAGGQVNNSTAIEATYSNGASQIRSEDGGLSSSGKSAAEKVASDMDATSAAFKSGGISSGAGQMEQIATDTEAFAKACTS